MIGTTVVERFRCPAKGNQVLSNGFVLAPFRLLPMCEVHFTDGSALENVSSARSVTSVICDLKSSVILKIKRLVLFLEKSTII